ncbi:MAG: D-glycero-beta-D-manno-heptose 1-phosphate adenylyltransferase [Candidatus Omnitrophica bacterium]|nr:D-glycero-beta-D-manno-heptose 1-phosphate adenylyltransferase [Candidatus Omnitrophota bacterium]
MLPLGRLLPVLKRLRRQGRSIAFTNGCFDVLHVGHLDVFEKISRMADVLVVAVNSDSSVRRLKGSRRPVVTERERARMVAALKPVDYVTIFSQDTPLRLIQAIRPDILAKGGDWKLDKIVGADVVKASGGRVVRIPYVKNRSTSWLLRRIERADGF